jgi:hypothetical protein
MRVFKLTLDGMIVGFGQSASTFPLLQDASNTHYCKVNGKVVPVLN